MTYAGSTLGATCASRRPLHGPWTPLLVCTFHHVGGTRLADPSAFRQCLEHGRATMPPAKVIRLLGLRMNGRRANTALKTAGQSAKLLAPTGVATRDDRSVIVSRALA